MAGFTDYPDCNQTGKTPILKVSKLATVRAGKLLRLVLVWRETNLVAYSSE